MLQGHLDRHPTISIENFERSLPIVGSIIRGVGLLTNQLVCWLRHSGVLPNVNAGTLLYFYIPKRKTHNLPGQELMVCYGVFTPTLVV